MAKGDRRIGLEGGPWLHQAAEDGSVWLNGRTIDYDGLCIGETMAAAVETLEALTELLQGPPAAWTVDK